MVTYRKAKEEEEGNTNKATYNNMKKLMVKKVVAKNVKGLVENVAWVRTRCGLIHTRSERRPGNQNAAPKCANQHSNTWTYMN